MAWWSWPGTFLRPGRRRRTGHHDGSDHHPDYRRDAAAGAATRSGKRLYGLGVSRWRTTLSITLRTATSGVITGVMLAFARVAGETAPLLFTAFGNQYWNWKLEPAHRRAVPADFHLRYFAVR